MSKIFFDKMLEQGDSVSIGDGYYADVLFNDVNDFSHQPYNRDYDEGNVGDEWPVTYVVKDAENNVIANYTKTTPYVSGGVKGDPIYNDNLAFQRREINEIADKLPKLLLQKVNSNEEQIFFLEKSLSSLRGKEIEPVQVKNVIPHDTNISLPGGNSVQVVYRDLDDHENQPYDPQYDEENYDEWPTTYIVKDQGGYVIDTIKADWPYISGGDDNQVNVERQNAELKKICENLTGMMEDKVESNKAQNVKLDNDYENLKNGNGPKASVPGL